MAAARSSTLTKCFNVVTFSAERSATGPKWLRFRRRLQAPDLSSGGVRGVVVPDEQPAVQAVVLPEMPSQDMMGVPPGPVMAGTKRDHFAIVRAEPEAAGSDVSGFGIQASTDGAGLGANPFEILRVQLTLDPWFQPNPAQGRVAAQAHRKSSRTRTPPSSRTRSIALSAQASSDSNALGAITGSCLASHRGRGT